MRTTTIVTSALLLLVWAAVAQVGSVDVSFWPKKGFNFEEPNYQRFQCVRQPDGRILTLGSFTNFNGVTRNHVARLHPDGSLDLSFDPGAGPEYRTYPVVEALALQPDGRVLIGGTFTNINGHFRRRIARLNEDGSLDASFNCTPGPNSTVRVIRVCPDGKILIGGYFYNFGDITRRFIARLHANGALDLTFDSSQNSIGLNCFELMPNGQIIIAGFPFYYNEISAKRIGRLNSNGLRDPTFSPPSGTDYHIDTVGLEPDGRIVIGGDFTLVNGTPCTNLARLHADGATDVSFNAGLSVPWWHPVKSVARTMDGKWLVGGYFTTNDGYPKNALMRVNKDGSLDTTFDPGTGPDDWVSSVLLDPDGRVVIGGQFTNVNGIFRKRIARLWGDPVLIIACDSAGTARLAWPSVFTNYVLQAANTVSGSTWADFPAIPTLASNQWVVTNTALSGARFFRLTKPNP